VLARQLADGGWNIYPAGPSEVNASVKAYSALKIAGFSADRPEMVRARERILQLGGIQACNSYVRINLSLFGLYPRRYVPTVPPEMVLLPGDILYEMSSWTRTIVVPLSIVQAVGRERSVPKGVTLEEIYAPGKRRGPSKRDGLAILFHHLDKLLKIWERRGPRNLRAKAIREAEHVSQPVFARYLNVSKNLVSDWERGAKKPGGPALRLLSIIQRSGLDAVA